jgi:hypothetical protein
MNKSKHLLLISIDTGFKIVQKNELPVIKNVTKFRTQFVGGTP